MPRIDRDGVVPRGSLFLYLSPYILYLNHHAIVAPDRITTSLPEGIVLNLSGVNQHLVAAFVLAVLTGYHPLSSFVHVEEVCVDCDVVGLPYEAFEGETYEEGVMFDTS